MPSIHSQQTKRESSAGATVIFVFGLALGGGKGDRRVVALKLRIVGLGLKCPHAGIGGLIRGGARGTDPEFRPLKELLVIRDVSRAQLGVSASRRRTRRRL